VRSNLEFILFYPRNIVQGNGVGGNAEFEIPDRLNEVELNGNHEKISEVCQKTASLFLYTLDGLSITL
jgi:hypothetical protein